MVINQNHMSQIDNETEFSVKCIILVSQRSIFVENN